jgi:hypothetical protein
VLQIIEILSDNPTRYSAHMLWHATCISNDSNGFQDHCKNVGAAHSETERSKALASQPDPA